MYCVSISSNGNVIDVTRNDMGVVKFNEHFTESAIFFHYVNVVFIKLEIPL